MRRLDKIAELAGNAARGVADVGTDHGYIPIKLRKSGFMGRIIASDINEMPLEAAIKNAYEYNLEDSIEFILTDGLNYRDYSDIDTVIIAGMGGDVICSILDRADWSREKYCRLILQPMTKYEILRYWLVNNGYEITAEELVLESGRIFRIFTAAFTGTNTALEDFELFTGKTEIIEHNSDYYRMLCIEEARTGKILYGLKPGSSKSGAFKIYRDIHEHITGLIPMEEKDG